MITISECRARITHLHAGVRLAMSGMPDAGDVPLTPVHSSKALCQPHYGIPQIDGLPSMSVLFGLYVPKSAHVMYKMNSCHKGASVQIGY